jgi:acyl-CoA hydrolase
VSGQTTMLVDLVFPEDTNHHGTLFGGVGLAHMDKVAFIAAARHGRVDFVTASCERVDFTAPGHLGDIVELAGAVVRVGRRSLDVRVDLHAESPVTGARRRCGTSLFHMVAVGEPTGGRLPPLQECRPSASQTDGLRMVEMVFPGQTSHYGSLYGGRALAAMAKAAFVAASRRARTPVVMAGSRRVDFRSQIRNGEVMEIGAAVARTGRSSMDVEVELIGETLSTGERRRAGEAIFTMVSVDAEHRPVPITSDASEN